MTEIKIGYYARYAEGDDSDPAANPMRIEMMPSDLDRELGRAFGTK